MLNVNKSVQEFSKLTKQQKIEKLKTMLEIIREDGNIFDDIYKLLEIDSEVSENILDTIYQALVRAMYSLQVEEIEKQIDKMEKIKQKIKNKAIEEQKEKENIDEILEVI